MVERAEGWRWSSAAVHCGLAADDRLLDLVPWQERWDAESWRRYLGERDVEEELAAIRECTHTGRPLGSAEFVHAMEVATDRSLSLGKRGRRKRGGESADDGQIALAFEKE